MDNDREDRGQSMEEAKEEEEEEKKEQETGWYGMEWCLEGLWLFLFLDNNPRGQSARIGGLILTGLAWVASWTPTRRGSFPAYLQYIESYTNY